MAQVRRSSLWVDNDDLGALNLYSRSADSFTDESEHVGRLFASHAAVAFAGADKVHHLNVALARRDLIGQAKGILMERFKITADQAFSILVRVSQDSNRKLFDLAEELAQTGHLAEVIPLPVAAATGGVATAHRHANAGHPVEPRP